MGGPEREGILAAGDRLEDDPRVASVVLNVFVDDHESPKRHRRDPGWVAAHNFEIVASFDDNAQALPATDENIEKLGSGRLKLRQKPGPRNSLGLVKFIFPNSMNIYLHSTPAQQLFAQPPAM